MQEEEEEEGRIERMEEEEERGRNGCEGGGDEIEQRTELRPWIRKETQIIPFSFSLHFTASVGTFRMDEVPKCRCAARWLRSVG